MSDDLDIVFHYPPELLSLLIDTIPRLCRTKSDVLLFFEGAGVARSLTAPWHQRLRSNSQEVGKFAIARDLLTKLNERGEASLRERREVLRRVTGFEDFSVCWPEDRLPAKGLVSEIRHVIDVKDSFARMNQEREAERRERAAKQAALDERRRIQRDELRVVHTDLLLLFSESNASKRGKDLESVLNRLFEKSGVLVREAFSLTGAAGHGVVEQIDGVVEVDGNTYLVEMKWQKAPMSRGDVSEHLVRIYHRGQARGVFISAAGYTDAAIETCTEALQKTVIVLASLEELVLLLEREGELQPWLRQKINAAILEKKPLYEPLKES